MRRLFDTHIALWVLQNDPRLTSEARRLLSDPASDKFVSVVSLWEVGIKHALPRQTPSHMPISANQARELLGEAGFYFLPVWPEHAAALDDLPLHHRDPFDRLLLAQAMSEPMPFVTHERRLAAYSELVVV